MAESPRCEDIRELIPELAGGLTPGDERAAALAHVSGCVECRVLLAEAATTVDELLLLAPRVEPPVGFESRVMATLRPVDAQRYRSGVLMLRAAAIILVAAFAAGVTWSQGAADRTVADQYRETLEVADGSYFRAADLTDGSSALGHVFAYQGSTSWVFVSVKDAPVSDTYQVRVITVGGDSQVIGLCEVRNGRGSWGTTIDMPVRDLVAVQLVEGEKQLMTARLG